MTRKPCFVPWTWDFGCETVSFSIKNPDQPHHNEPELAPVEQKSEQVLKIPVIFTGEKHTKDGLLIEEELVNTLDTSLALEVFIHWAFNLFSQRFEQIEFVN